MALARATSNPSLYEQTLGYRSAYVHASGACRRSGIHPTISELKNEALDMAAVTRHALRVYAALTELGGNNENILDALIPFFEPILELIEKRSG